MLYKLKINDDGLLQLKARIAPHGNEDMVKDQMTKTCAGCRPTGIRKLESISELNVWTIYKWDVTEAFLQTGKA